MKRTSSFTALFIIGAGLVPLAEASDLTVNVTGISTPQGSILLGLYDETTYKGDGSIDGATLQVEGDQISVTFEDLAPGEYAIQLYHDVNGDGELNTNAFGMPTEPFAFSNNAKGRFGPAKWKAAKFSVGSDDTIHTIAIK